MDETCPPGRCRRRTAVHVRRNASPRLHAAPNGHGPRVSPVDLARGVGLRTTGSHRPWTRTTVCSRPSSRAGWSRWASATSASSP